MSSWKVSIWSTTFLTVRTWAAASAHGRGRQRQRGDLLGRVAVAQQAGGGVRGQIEVALHPRGEAVVGRIEAFGKPDLFREVISA
ncbi:hypothetical protein FHU36_004476 [Nonomuraea muscovyensis]|uniref:Uncharacterized protein n=1 Tax=Nonomuraea muscovyensis TaxID=1124761 RepID=A0A7X0F0R1_9ACTN|nr:hypothetical protein [Nonomuraea muscovyensis]MBB6347931.1 hypothetical protein [Nonomuraea muscovyensis]